MILAQTSVVAIAIPAGVLFGAIIGLYVWVSRQRNEVNKQMTTHLADSKIHPNKKDIVFGNVCDERVKGIETVIRLHGEHEDERSKILKEDIDEIKAMLRSK